MKRFILTKGMELDQYFKVEKMETGKITMVKKTRRPDSVFRMSSKVRNELEEVYTSHIESMELKECKNFSADILVLSLISKLYTLERTINEKESNEQKEMIK
jgi:hypothetical protein